MGYHRAGFDVVGVDLHPMPRFPFDFQQGDAIAVLRRMVRYWDSYGFVAIHASPPCQRHSAMTACRPGLADEYPDLITPVRDLLKRIGLPYVIENVPGAPLENPVTLCGQMFGLELYRHRLFEANFPIAPPAHPEHRMPASKAGHWAPGTVMSVAGHVSPMWKAREVMGGIDWMNRDELGESIPPAYTQHIGAALRSHLRSGWRCIQHGTRLSGPYCGPDCDELTARWYGAA